MTKLIGLTGKARAGKDTVGTYLKKFNFKTLSFAQPIRDALAAMFGFDHNHFHGAWKEAIIEPYGKSPRQMMQTLGTEWGRQHVHQDLWLMLAKKKIDAWQAQGYNVVVTDVRFENEADFIRDNGGEMWHIVRPDVGAVAAHVSEAGVARQPHDKVLYNDSTVHTLYAQANMALGPLAKEIVEFDSCLNIAGYFLVRIGPDVEVRIPGTQVHSRDEIFGIFETETQIFVPRGSLSLDNKEGT